MDSIKTVKASTSATYEKSVVAAAEDQTVEASDQMPHQTQKIIQLWCESVNTK